MQSIENKNVPSKKISPRCDADAPDFTLIPVYLLIHAGIYSGRTTDDELAEKKFWFMSYGRTTDKKSV